MTPKQANALTEAFYAGRKAFFEGRALESNPYPAGEESAEWARVYKNARKASRFDATIAARKVAQANR